MRGSRTVTARVLAAAALVVLASAVVAGAQVPPALPGQARPGQTTPPPGPTTPARAPKTGTAVLRGQVVAADSGMPMVRARVSIVSADSAERRSTTTDASGRWEIKQLPAGRYVATAAKPPWVSLQFGQRYGLEPGKPVELTDGQTVETMDFRLPRGAVIAGRVADDLGDPAAFVRVNALRLQYFNGRRQLVRSGVSAQTNDIGQYRLYGLPPGTYFVATDSATWRSAYSEDPGVSFAQTYYPGTTVAGDAQPVAVRTGQERSGVDFGQVAARLARLSGVVVDSQGAAVTNRRIQLIQDTRGPSGTVGGLGPGGATAGPDGRWSVASVAPGAYVVAALPPASEEAAPGTERGVLSVTVTGQDIDGLVIRTAPGARVTGQIEFDASDPPTVTPGVRVTAEEGVPILFSGPGVSKVQDDWAFEVNGISPGERVLRLSGLPSGYALKAVFIDGSDVIDTLRKFGGTEDVSGVRLVVTRRVSELTGAVVDDKARPVRDYSVLMFSTDSSKWGPGTRYRSTARPDQNGRYKVVGLPPGEYFAIALEYLNPGEAEDPEFLGEIRSHATKITVGEGEAKALDLKLAADARGIAT